MSDLFFEPSFSVEICTEKQYEKDTGEKLETTDVYTEEITEPGFTPMKTADKQEDIDLGLKIEKVTKEEKDKVFDESKADKKDGLDIIKPTVTNTTNTFLNTVQQHEIEKINKEAKRVAQSDIEFPYIKAKFMTDAELQLYNFMNNNIACRDRVAIFPKVRLGDIIEVDKRLTTSMKPFYKVAYKHVDFLLCKADTLEIICVVELDDYTHNTQERKETDMFIMQALQTAGINTQRIRFKIATIEKSDLYFIEEEIYKALAPTCPMCGKAMLPRINRRNNNRFYACIDNISCRHTIDINELGEKLP